MIKAKLQAEDPFKGKLDLPSKTGVVIKEKGLYYLVVSGRKKRISTGYLYEKTLDKLIDTKVTAVISGKNIVAIYPVERKKPGWCYIIICYVPADEIYKRIDLEVQKNLLQKFVDAGVISKPQFNVVFPQIS